jgi:hypothetical protein
VVAGAELSQPIENRSHMPVIQTAPPSLGSALSRIVVC